MKSFVKFAALSAALMLAVACGGSVADPSEGTDTQEKTPAAATPADTQIQSVKPDTGCSSCKPLQCEQSCHGGHCLSSPDPDGLCCECPG